jgi:hypothetical protein
VSRGEDAKRSLAYAGYAVTAAGLALWIGLLQMTVARVFGTAYGDWGCLIAAVVPAALTVGGLAYVVRDKPLWLARLTWFILPLAFFLLPACAVAWWSGAVLFFLAAVFGAEGYSSLLTVLGALMLANAVAALFLRRAPAVPA